MKGTSFLGFVGSLRNGAVQRTVPIMTIIFEKGC
jgi:hypothetical protein